MKNELNRYTNTSHLWQWRRVHI